MTHAFAEEVDDVDRSDHRAGRPEGLECLHSKNEDSFQSMSSVVLLFKRGVGDYKELVRRYILTVPCSLAVLLRLLRVGRLGKR